MCLRAYLLVCCFVCSCVVCVLFVCDCVRVRLSDYSFCFFAVQVRCCCFGVVSCCWRFGVFVVLSFCRWVVGPFCCCC